MIPNTKPHIGYEEIDAAVRVLNSGWLGLGPETEAFEKEFAKYVSVKYAVFTNSCSSALKMAYRWFKRKGHTSFYLNTQNTYCATYAAGIEEGLEWDKYEQNGIKVNVHWGGVKDTTKCDIEDSAHRIEPKDKMIGKIRCYSFHPTKNMTAIHGGMLVTNNRKIYKQCLLWRNDGIVRGRHGRFDYKVIDNASGFEGNDLMAAVGRIQLQKLPEFNKLRNDLVRRYNRAFNTNWTGNHIYPLEMGSYKNVVKAVVELEKRGISCKSHYPHTSTCMTLPLFPSLSFKNQDKVIKEVKEVRENIYRKK